MDIQESDPAAGDLSQQQNEQQYYSKHQHENRRSVDWRDSGIVIDEDGLYNFGHIETICDLTSTQIAFKDSSITSQFNLSSHITLDQDDDGDTILHLAVVGCCMDKVRDLIKICDTDAINNMMQTPLHVATMANRPEMVDLLVKAGAHLQVYDRRGNTPLHLACQKGFVEAAVVLLEGAILQGILFQYLELANFDGQSCLHLAATNNRFNILELLICRYQANPSHCDSRAGETILHKAIGGLNVDLVEFIVRLEKHCNNADFSGRQPLAQIRLLKESRREPTELERLVKIEQLVSQRVTSCQLQGGCCALSSQVSQKKAILDPPSSSSDYSDSDSDMN